MVDIVAAVKGCVGRDCFAWLRQPPQRAEYFFAAAAFVVAVEQLATAEVFVGAAVVAAAVELEIVAAVVVTAVEAAFAVDPFVVAVIVERSLYTFH